MKRNSLQNIFENNKVLMLLSFLLAVLLWGYVVLNVNNQHTTVIRNVPINLTYRQSMYQSMGLDIIESDITTVDVTVTGTRGITGNLKAEDILIYPNITGVSGRGKFTFPLTAEKTSSLKDFNIDSISSNNVTIRLDSLITKEFSVGVNISTISVDGDCIADKPTATPATLTITGPEYKVNSISRVEAATVMNETISQTSILPARLMLYDENGAEIDQNLLTLSVDTFDVTIPVMKEIDLPVKVEYVNIPTGFDTSILHQSLSASHLRLAVPANRAASASELVVGYIDLNTLEPEKSYTFDLQLPTGYRSMDQVTQISATISGSNLVEKRMNIDDIKVINDSTNSINVLTEVIKNVVIVGEKADVDALADGDVIAQIDAGKLELATGQQTVEVSFVLPSTNAAFVRGSYTVSIRN